MTNPKLPSRSNEASHWDAQYVERTDCAIHPTSQDPQTVNEITKKKTAFYDEFEVVFFLCQGVTP
jgi:hypothetical protein